MKSLLPLITLLALAVSAFGVQPALIPIPMHIQARDGTFVLGRKTAIYADTASTATGEFLAARLRQGTGYRIPVKPPGKSTAGGIVLTTEGADPSLGAEGYEMSVTPDAVLIRAPSQAGMFYGAQTFLQLLPPEVFALKPARTVKWQAPCVEIKDQPRFAWRGLMLDVSRHFFNKSEVEQILDAMAMHKLNTFHWHLVDDQGWRIEIKQYPRLTEVGAWRKGINFHLDPKSSTAYGPDGRYGGFYTQEDIREVVRYAAARHITVVPEIEMPGHSSAALAAYPQFSCTGGPFSTDMDGGVFPGVYCAGNDGTFEFLENVLTEVFSLFPSQYVHVGGDEVPAKPWEDCQKCQARMKAEGLKDTRQLESYFIKRIEKIVNAHGKSLIGWSEIREGGLAQNAAIMDWIGGATEAATAGHNVVMTPTGYCYLDHYQSRDHSTEPHAIGGFLPLRQVYSFEPVPENLPAEFQAHIMGAQGNLWTEYIPSLQHAEYMIFPRETALAELTWSPKAARNWDDFLQRLQTDDRRLQEMGVNYRRNPTATGSAAERQ
jgi:hexosaminidase